ncbi:hypothetical protein [Dactylosporangium cerinum]
MQRRGIVTGAACAGTALLAVVLYAINQQHPLSVLGTALLIALAATAAGGLLGFLFGIPRAVRAHRTSSRRTSARGTTPTPTWSRSPTG